MNERRDVRQVGALLLVVQVLSDVTGLRSSIKHMGELKNTDVDLKSAVRLYVCCRNEKHED